MTFIFLPFAHRARPKNCVFQSRIKPAFQSSRRVGGDRCAHGRGPTRSGNVKRKSSRSDFPRLEARPGGKATTAEGRETQGRRLAAAGADGRAKTSCGLRGRFKSLGSDSEGGSCVPKPESALVIRLFTRSNGCWLEDTYERDQDRAFRCRS